MISRLKRKGVCGSQAKDSCPTPEKKVCIGPDKVAQKPFTELSPLESKAF
jgi:hypothetical protein